MENQNNQTQETKSSKIPYGVIAKYTALGCALGAGAYYLYCKLTDPNANDVPEEVKEIIEEVMK